MCRSVADEDAADERVRETICSLKCVAVRPQDRVARTGVVADREATRCAPSLGRARVCNNTITSHDPIALFFFFSKRTFESDAEKRVQRSAVAGLDVWRRFARPCLLGCFLKPNRDIFIATVFLEVRSVHRQTPIVSESV